MKKTPLKEIIDFFDNYNFNDQVVEISLGEKVTDAKKFYNSHVKFLKNNTGKKIFLPYYLRLEKLYKKLKK